MDLSAKSFKLSRLYKHFPKFSIYINNTFPNGFTSTRLDGWKLLKSASQVGVD